MRRGSNVRYKLSEFLEKIFVYHYVWRERERKELMLEKKKKINEIENILQSMKDENNPVGKLDLRILNVMF